MSCFCFDVEHVYSLLIHTHFNNNINSILNFLHY